MQDIDDQDELPIDPRLNEELNSLLARLCDGEMSLDDRHRLNQVLDGSFAARRYYLRYIAVHSALAASAGGRLGHTAIDAQMAIERMTLARFAGHTDSASTCGLEPSTADRVARWRAATRWVATSAAMLLVAGAVVLWTLISRLDDDDRIGDVVATRPANALDEGPSDRLPVAEVTYVSDSTVWQKPNDSHALASRVRSGQSLALERGQIELTYSTGAKLLLTGPSEFLIQPTGGKLRLGELVARVPVAGHGFTIETPHGKVVDLGTEFGVVVDDFGVSQVSVFEGKVETLPRDNAGIARDKIELTTGRAIQWTDESIIPIAVQGRRYQRLGADVATMPLNRPMQASIDERFRENTLNPTNWKSFGVVLPTHQGLRLGGDAGVLQRPYLITAQEFDPSHGAIAVVCDLRIENIEDAEHASFAILTRSTDSLSKPGTPWQDMLAHCLRCRLKADLRSGEGMLEAGTKYEADRELTNISWGGFSRPQPDTLYRVEMRDDGLNVAFSVSLVENPSVHKTITCRSLFRGDRNFIALEGSSSGTTIIERLSILQEESTDDQSPLAAATAASGLEQRVDANESAQQLDGLVPAAARLVLSDDFEEDMLNSRIWMTLGDVAPSDGQLQLGLPNPDQHIDTWRARPYLLTTEKFNPADHTLTILGKVTFSENFLHGYGGSFAVMTRADKAHGGGPGWENSILRHGVRSNFWPTAFGFDHSLEIHEKSAPSTASYSLLTSKGLQINPRARSYLFQVIDDGKSATLTLIDASDPGVRESISHTTLSPSFSRGHIGFESCWGSPVLLDNIRIYESQGPAGTSE